MKKTAQEFSTALEEIQDSKTPPEVKKQTKKVVRQVTDTLQVISDPKTPAKERAALTEVVRQVTDTLQVISDPKTPAKEQAKAKKTLDQLTTRLHKHLEELHDHPKKEDPKKEDPKKEDPKKEDPKKEDPKKEDPNNEITPTGGGVSDEQACKAMGGIPAETQSGEFYCGNFSTLSAPAPQLTQVELDEIKKAEVYVGCLKDIAGIFSGPFVKAVLFVDGVVATVEDARAAMEAGGVVQIVSQFNNPASGEDQTLVWDVIQLNDGGGCFKLYYDRFLGTRG
ncbi:hypothetical protein ACIP6X_34105 [Streptomyces coeruleorubidus]|uniref:hypothetical protein n=1 Tax=Streptomyces coeruleorubidus TaxID=116188 RepID=UPI0037FB452C